MAVDELIGLTNRLLAGSLAPSALAARLTLGAAGERGEPALREQIDRVLDEPGVAEPIAAGRGAARSGRSARALALLSRAAFHGCREIERTWNPPLRFVVGTRA